MLEVGEEALGRARDPVDLVGALHRFEHGALIDALVLLGEGVVVGEEVELAADTAGEAGAIGDERDRRGVEAPGDHGAEGDVTDELLAHRAHELAADGGHGGGGDVGLGAVIAMEGEGLAVPRGPVAGGQGADALEHGLAGRTSSVRPREDKVAEEGVDARAAIDPGEEEQGLLLGAGGEAAVVGRVVERADADAIAREVEALRRAVEPGEGELATDAGERLFDAPEAERVEEDLRVAAATKGDAEARRARRAARSRRRLHHCDQRPFPRGVASAARPARRGPGWRGGGERGRAARPG